MTPYRRTMSRRGCDDLFFRGNGRVHSQQGGIVGGGTVQVFEPFPCGQVDARAFFRGVHMIVSSDGKQSPRQKTITLAGGGRSLFFRSPTPRLMSVADSASSIIQRASSRVCCSDNCLHTFSVFLSFFLFMPVILSFLWSF